MECTTPYRSYFGSLIRGPQFYGRLRHVSAAVVADRLEDEQSVDTGQRLNMSFFGLCCSVCRFRAVGIVPALLELCFQWPNP